ncbi:MAG: hypothetical protein HYZ37_00250 [Candidatus Solibacter usitatus]|nr:hypothetical protein [Candidatus Solibacter usitatus]
MHDSIRLEDAGIATVPVATHEFRTAAGAQASLLGRPGFPVVFVMHPIQDQTQAEIEAKADAAIAEIVTHLIAS